MIPAPPPGVIPVRHVHDDLKFVLMQVELTQHLNDADVERVLATVAGKCIQQIAERRKDHYLEHMAQHLLAYTRKGRHQHTVDI